jgi:hypothetical protein
MELPSLILTADARAALIAAMSNITEYEPVATVLWATAGSSGWLLPDGREEFRFLGPHWMIGYYDKAKLPSEEVVEIDGVPFVFGQDRISMRLDGATLDYANGRFTVSEGAG